MTQIENIYLPRAGPFDLEGSVEYRKWRETKLSDYPTKVADLLVPLADPSRLADAESAGLRARIRKTNMVLFRVAGDIADAKEMVRALGAAVGLVDLDPNRESDDDGITQLRVAAAGSRTRYIPYTNRGINWHTDGYYNTLDRQIYGMILYCLSDAQSGGANQLLDHDIAYILMRDEDPDLVRVLCRLDAMVLPGNEVDGKMVRPDRAGPVFMVDPVGGFLHMRFTLRKRNIVWSDDGAVTAAVAFLETLFDSDSRYIFRHRMAPGEGLICNNVLHDRAGFEDGDPAAGGKTRNIFRARFCNRVRAS